MKRTLALGSLLLTLATFSTPLAQADTLCIRKRARVSRTGRLNLQKAITTTTEDECKRGFFAPEGNFGVQTLPDSTEVSLLPIDCELEVESYDTVFTKIGTIGTFTKNSDTTSLLLTLSTTVNIEGIPLTAAVAGVAGQATLQLRVDNRQSPIPNSNISILSSESDENTPVVKSIRFEGFSAGNHEVSIWIAHNGPINALGEEATINSQCNGRAQLTVTEY